MKLAIITAMTEETRAVVRACGGTTTTYTGKTTILRCRLGRHEVALIESGMGAANAASAAGTLVREERPDLLVSAGFCGGVRPGLSVGDAVLADRVVFVSADGLEEVPLTRLPEIEPDPPANGVQLVRGTFATTRAIMPKKKLAVLFPEQERYLVAEMESAAIAQVAAARGIPFIGLRTVSDPYDEELEFSLDDFCDESMRISIPRVLLTIARKPRIIPQLIRLARNSRIAADSLSRAMKSILDHL